VEVVSSQDRGRIQPGSRQVAGDCRRLVPLLVVQVKSLAGLRTKCGLNHGTAVHHRLQNATKPQVTHGGAAGA
jgi:hypothetical protein